MHLEVEEVKCRVEEGEKLSWVLLHSYTVLNIFSSLGGGGVGGIRWNDYVDMGAYFRAGISCRKYTRIQSVAQRKHNNLQLQRSAG
jgi:hypothetical protein